MSAAVSERAEKFPWWLVLVQGICILIIGILLLVSPRMTTLILIQFLGIYWLIDGIFSLVRMFMKHTDTHWGWLLARGILGILAGLLVINNPLWSSFLIPATLALLLGIYGIIGGGIGLIEAFKGGGWGAGILGVVSIIFGLILLTHALVAGLTLPWVIGIFAVIGGVAMIIFSFRLR